MREISRGINFCANILLMLTMIHISLTLMDRGIEIKRQELHLMRISVVCVTKSVTDLTNNPKS